MRFLNPLLILFFVGCASAPKINEIPKYGNAKKTPHQLKTDSIFIENSTKDKSRDSASRYFANRGFDFLNSGDHSTAIKRFNHSWLLDSNSYLAYWGFASYYRITKKLEDSVQTYFKMAYSLNSNDCDLTFQTLTSNFLLKSQGRPYDISFVENILRKVPELNCPNSESDYKKAICDFDLEKTFKTECDK